MMNEQGKIVQLMVGQVSRIRDRDAALTRLVPKVMRILAARGQKLPELGGSSVQLRGQTELSASFIDADRTFISAAKH